MDYLWSPWRMTYIQTHKVEDECAFCLELSRQDGVANLIIHRGRRAFVILNRYPYTSGHVMIVPYEHLSTLDALDQETRAEMMELVNSAVQTLQEVYQPQGFNIGMNIGDAAGAGIADHIHLHVVPRWMGDTNFMSTLGMTRVLPEALADSFNKIKQAWERLQGSTA